MKNLEFARGCVDDTDPATFAFGGYFELFSKPTGIRSEP